MRAEIPRKNNETIGFRGRQWDANDPVRSESGSIQAVRAEAGINPPAGDSPLREITVQTADKILSTWINAIVIGGFHRCPLFFSRRGSSLKSRQCTQSFPWFDRMATSAESGVSQRITDAPCTFSAGRMASPDRHWTAHGEKFSTGRAIHGNPVHPVHPCRLDFYKDVQDRQDGSLRSELIRTSGSEPSVCIVSADRDRP